MAHYTELLVDYLRDGQHKLPVAFNQIEGFEELFIGTFADYEIGFETEELFKIKLETKANLVIPKYVERIKIIQNYLQQAEGEPIKIHVEKEDVIYNMGATKSKQTDLPINEISATPSSINENDEVVNKNTRVHEVKDYGASDEEVMRILKDLNGKVENVIQKLLDEFKPLFMGVY